MIKIDDFSKSNPSDTTSFSLSHLSTQLKQLCSKIWQAVCSFFSSFCCCHGRFSFFNAREISLLRDPTPPKIISPNKNDAPNPLPAKEIQPVSLAEIAGPTAAPPYLSFDSSLEEFRQLMRDFSSLLIDTCHQKFFASTIESIQNKAPTVPPVIKSIATLLIEMGDRASKPLFQRFSQQKTQIIDQALQKIFNSLLKDPPHIKNAEQHTAEREELYTLLKGKLQQDLKNTKLQTNQSLDKSYIDPILQWLLFSDHTTPISTLFLPAENFREDLIDKVMELSVTHLVERKIDYYATQLQTLLQDGLDSIVAQTAKINGERLTNFFSERFSDLVSNMPFPQTFDAIVKDAVGGQINGYLSAISDPDLLLEKSNIEKSKKLLQTHPKNLEEHKNKILAENHLKAVGDDENAYLEQRFLEAFSRQPICSLQTHDIITHNQKYSRKAIEKALYTGIAERLLTLMLAPKKRISANGTIEEVEALTELWNQLYLPPEFYHLLKHVEELSSEFVTPEAVEMFSRIKEPLLEGLKSIFHATVQDLLKKQLLQLVQTAIEKITIPGNLDKLMAENILPAANRQLVKYFVEQELGLQVSKIAPLFHQLVIQKGESYIEHKKRLIATLSDLAKSKFRHFKEAQFHVAEKSEEIASLAFEGIAEEEWSTLISPLLVNFEQIILGAVINGTPFNPATAAIKDVEEILKKHFEQSSIDNDPFYGDVAMDLLFKVGEFPLEFLITPILKKSISASLTGAIAEMRGSHHFLINSITNGLKDTLLDRRFVNGLLSEPANSSESLISQKLAHQIRTTASLAHDLMMRKVESRGTVYKFMTKSVVGHSPKTIEETIKRLYQKLCCRDILNQNLVIRCVDELFGSCSIAAQLIQNRDNTLTQHRLIELENIQ